MPVSKLQSELLRLLASRRDPESFVAGGVAINRTGPRISRDIDIFHDREERVATRPTSPEIARAMLERYTPKPHGTDGQDNCS